MKKNLIAISITVIFIFNFTFLIIISNYSSAQSDEGNIIYVNLNGLEDYTKIQDAINAANNHDTVYVYSGTYNENIFIDKIINLVGEDAETTIIDGGKNDDVVTLSPSSNWVNITGFTIQYSGFQDNNAGINVNSDYNRIAANIIKNCKCGIALDFWGHNCIVDDNTLEKNAYGIIVYSVNPNNNIFYRNRFVNNIINAYDDSNSKWDYQNKGNYWDDYNGTDSNDDGVGDSPYNITGGCAKDNYPLIEPAEETPGFEMLILIISFTLVIYLKKKRNYL